VLLALGSHLVLYGSQTAIHLHLLRLYRSCGTKAALPARNALREAETFSSFGWHEEHRPGAKAYFMAPFLHFSMQSMHATQRL
jgi:hypothetical protein